MVEGKLGASFRDPSGFVFSSRGRFYRQINLSYKDNFDFLISSKLYSLLTKEKLLIPHREVEKNVSKTFGEDGYKVIQPQQIPFVSYPYEWSFSQLKDAALLTLQLQKVALEYEMSLKDASAYNVQFLDGKPVFIDTLSFEKYQKGKPWVAYRQFCQHFLVPLALMSYTDVDLNKLLRLFTDGVPLNLASKLLPLSSRFKFSLLIHLHLHSASQRRYENRVVEKRKINFSKRSFVGLIDSLEGSVKSLKWKPVGTEWADYYSKTNYKVGSFKEKARIIEDYLSIVKPKSVWDLGANNGEFSRIASKKGIETVAFDIDPAAVEQNYLIMKEKKEKYLLPLIQDFTNPSPSLGWNNLERLSLTERGPADCLLALALVHHLSISNNVPFTNLAEYFSKIGNNLIIEFVPKSDSQVQKLLSTREDIFPTYGEENFEKEFGKFFLIKQKTDIKASKRSLYLMTRK